LHFFNDIIELKGRKALFPKEVDSSYLAKLFRHKITGAVRKGYGEPSSMEKIVWELKPNKR
jgi:hypothetical protein